MLLVGRHLGGVTGLEFFAAAAQAFAVGAAVAELGGQLIAPGFAQLGVLALVGRSCLLLKR